MPDGLDAGSVRAEVGADFNPAGFVAFDARMKSSAAAAEAFESKVNASTKRLGEIGPAASKASSGVSGLENANRRAAASMDTLGHAAKIGAAGGLLAVGVAAGVAVKQAADFERSMRNVNSIAKLNETQFKKLSQSVLQLSGKTAQTPKQLADGLYDLVSSGIKAKDSIGVLKAAAIAASAGLTDTQTAIVPLVGALNAYHLKAGDAAKVSDILFQAVNRGVLHFKDLATGLGPVLPLAASLKIPLNDVGAAISTLTKEGIPAADAFTYMANGMKVFLAPHKTLQAAIEKTGFATGDALVKAKGFQGALEAVAGTTNGTKGELAKLFPDIRALKDVLGLTGANAKSAAGDLANFTASATKGATAKVFAEQAKSASFQFQQLKADLSAVAIEVGTVVLPMLGHLAGGAEKALGSFIKSGGAKNLGNDLSAGFREAGHVISDLVPIAKGAAEALGGISKALDLGSANHLEAILAGILGFKAAGVVAPLVARLVTQIRLLSTAPSAAALGSDVLAMVNPFTAAALAAAGLGAAIVLLSGQESAEAQAAEANAAAHRDELNAVQALHHDEVGLVQLQSAAAHATLDHKDAVKALSDYMNGGGKRGTLEYQHLHLAVTDTLTAEGAAHEKLQAKIKVTNAAQASVKTKAGGALDQTSTELAKAQAAVTALKPGTPGFTPDKLASAEDRLTAATKAHAVALQDLLNLTSVANIKALDLKRTQDGQTRITLDNAQGYRYLESTLTELGKAIPKSVKTRYELDGDQNALAKLGILSTKLQGVASKKTIAKILTDSSSAAEAVLAFRALLAGVKAKTVAHVLATTAGTDTVNALNAAIDRLHDKTIHIVAQQSVVGGSVAGAAAGGLTRKPGRAAGRGPGNAEMALVGEGRAPEDVYDPATGRHIVVDRPTFMALPHSAYVIPREKQYAGRAAGLMMQLARQMGWQMFKKGKAPAKPTAKPKFWGDHYVPAKLDPLRFPVDDIQTKRDAALKSYDAAKGYIHDEPDKIKALRTRETDLSHQKVKAGSEAARKKAEHLRILRGQIAAANKKLAKERHDLPELRKAYHQREKQLSDAKAYAAKIVKAQALVDIDRNDMDLANKHHDQGAYDRAKTKRIKDLGALRALYADAQAHVPKDSQYFLELQKNIGTTDVDTTDTTNETSDDQSQDASDQSSTGMTKAEREQLSAIQAAEALAELTPDTADDLAAFGREESLLSQVLGEIQANPAARGGNDAIAAVATQLKSVRDSIKALNDPTADQQAQIDQANARTEAANANVRAATDALSALGSSGDIGVGGYRNAMQAGAQGPTVVFQSYVPPSPAQAFELGSHVVRGLTYQNPVQSPRIPSGA